MFQFLTLIAYFSFYLFNTSSDINTCRYVFIFPKFKIRFNFWYVVINLKREFVSTGTFFYFTSPNSLQSATIKKKLKLIFNKSLRS